MRKLFLGIAIATATVVLISCSYNIKTVGPRPVPIEDEPKAGSPPPKPVCPKGIKEDWCRPHAKGEFGTTTLGNTSDEEEGNN